MKKGFTLIEILIVVGIVAILASVVLIGLRPTQTLGRDTRRIADLKQTQVGLQLYFQRCGFYPGEADSSNPCGTGFKETASCPGGAACWISLERVLKANGAANSLSKDPRPDRSYDYLSKSGAGYVLRAQLEGENHPALRDDVDGTIDSKLNCEDASGFYCVML